MRCLHFICKVCCLGNFCVVFDMLNAVSVNTDDINIVAVRLCEICDLCLNNLPCEVNTGAKDFPQLAVAEPFRIAELYRTASLAMISGRGSTQAVVSFGSGNDDS